MVFILHLMWLGVRDMYEKKQYLLAQHNMMHIDMTYYNSLPPFNFQIVSLFNQHMSITFRIHVYSVNTFNITLNVTAWPYAFNSKIGEWVKKTDFLSFWHIVNSMPIVTLSVGLMLQECVFRAQWWQAKLNKHHTLCNQIKSSFKI